GLLLPLVVPNFPHALSLVAGSVTVVLLAGGSAAAMGLQRGRDQLARRAGGLPGPRALPVSLALPLTQAGRAARRGLAAAVSVLLCLVVVATTLLVTKPAALGSSPRGGYDFRYTYHAPTHRGGAVTVGLWEPLVSLAPNWLLQFPLSQQYIGLWNGCVVQLPDLTLRALTGWQADQCTRVPTVANRD